MSNINNYISHQLKSDPNHQQQYQFPLPSTQNNAYNNIPMQQSQSYSMNNESIYSQQMEKNSSNSHYSLLSQSNLQNLPFNPQISTSVTPLSSLNPNSVPLMMQNSNATSLLPPNNNQSQLLPASVAMTPQLSVNSQMGLNDLSSPELNTSLNMNSNSNATPSPIDTFGNYNPELSNVPSRTVYLGNIPKDVTANEILNHVRSGTVESIKLIPSKNCAFVSFLDEKPATLFHSDAILKRLAINNQDIKVGWGKPSPVQPVVASCVQRYNATRNVYIGNLPDGITENELRQDVKEFGEIDTIKLLLDKRIAFVHFTSIIAAIRCVQSLPLVEKYKDRRIFYGKDRCAFITKTQQHNAAQYLGLNPNQDNFLTQVNRDLIANALVQQSNAAAMIATSTGGNANLGNRTIYLGNLHPDSTIEEICNVVRGGILQNIRLIQEKHVCFITFIDPISAAQFYAMSSLHGLIIHNRKIKVGWGKHSGPLPNSINLAVGNGASRNIYIGGLDKIPEIVFSKEKLFNDFKEFGDIEQINFFQERHCCFVNFTNISNAIKAIDGIRNNPDYQKCKINFGKDRCGNTPRQFQLGSNSSSNSNNHNSGISSNGNSNANTNINSDSTTSSYINDGLSTHLKNINLQTSSTNANSTQFSSHVEQSSEGDDDDDDDDNEYIDEAKIRYQPLGIIIDKQSNSTQNSMNGH